MTFQFVHCRGFDLLRKKTRKKGRHKLTPHVAGGCHFLQLLYITLDKDLQLLKLRFQDSPTQTLPLHLRSNWKLKHTKADRHQQPNHFWEGLDLPEQKGRSAAIGTAQKEATEEKKNVPAKTILQAPIFYCPMPFKTHSETTNCRCH